MLIFENFHLFWDNLTRKAHHLLGDKGSNNLHNNSIHGERGCNRNLILLFETSVDDALLCMVHCLPMCINSSRPC